MRFMAKLPLKKRRIQKSSDPEDDPPISSSSRYELQPCFSSQGGPSPREVLPTLPQGLSAHEDIINATDLERSFGSLSTLALASNSESTDDELLSPSSSSSAYGSASDEAANIAVRGPHHGTDVPVRSTAERAAHAAPSTRHRRRSRKERAARNAAWADSVPMQPATIELIDLTIASDTDDACSEIQTTLAKDAHREHRVSALPSASDHKLSDAELVHPANFADDSCVKKRAVVESDSDGTRNNQEMPIDVKVYRALCAAYEDTLHPVDGEALLDYVKPFVAREKERRRIAKLRADRKRLAEQQQPEATAPGEAGNAADDDGVQARPAKKPRRRRAPVKKPAKQPANVPRTLEQELGQFVELRPPLEKVTNHPGVTSATSVAPAATSTSLAATSTYTADTIAAVATLSEDPQASMATLATPGPPTPSLAFGVDLARSDTSTPFPSMSTAWTISSAAIASEGNNLDISAFLEKMLPLPSPAVVVQPSVTMQQDSQLRPLEIMDLDDAINESLRVPPTPATPEHLKGIRYTIDPATEPDTNIAPPASGAQQPPLRMRIRRILDAADPDQDDNFDM
ncbi:hypothetical protein QAD02_000813 [Eretmocerus hayati]|uniref:Uncharacterized protein n=1 Tax=Eretmocerus hayati TaxID=131215 RepID=A0ACC2NEQ2_9HYME|nr:hypothetical protein QAD02_000813 [Eretmocerus hayati]